MNALTRCATLLWDYFGKEIHLILLFDPMNSTSQHGCVPYHCKNIEKNYFQYKNVVCVICETYHDDERLENPSNDSCSRESR